MKKGLFRIVLLWVLLMSGQAVFSEYGQPLTNGTFDSDLSSWTIDPDGVNSVVWYDQAAVLLNPGDYPLDPTWPFQESFGFLSTYPAWAGGNLDYSSLFQPLTLSNNVDMISFDVTMEIYNRFSDSETDVLTAVVWYGPTMSEWKRIYRLSSFDVQWYEVDGNYMYDDWDEGLELWTRHMGFQATCTYDVSEWAGQDVIVEFKLDHDYMDGVRTAVTVDDVAISETGDATPPAVTVGEMIELWPPNHKYRTFNLSDCVLSVGDDTDGQLDIDEVGTILSIYSDEPEDVKGRGDGDFLDDIVLLGTSSFKVRSERQGTNNGRIYGVTFEVKDSSGNSTVATFYLGVPHDQSDHSPIVDDGPESGYTINAF
jgi:hypothetical protein